MTVLIYVYNKYIFIYLYYFLLGFFPSKTNIIIKFLDLLKNFLDFIEAEIEN